jgi:hypothetical protein
MNVSDGSDVDGVPRDWYADVAEIQIDSRGDIWEAWQGDIEMESRTFSTETARQAHERYMALREEYGLRSMSAGDIIEVDGTLNLVCAFGFTEVEWGDEPDVEF